MEAIIISGLPASGKTSVAMILAAKLKVEALSGSDMLREMAADRGFKPEGEDWWDTKEGIRFLEERKKDPNFDKEADKRLQAKINKGNIVLTSYTAPWLSDKGFKVWLATNLQTRAKRMSERDHTTITEAMKTLKIRDQENSTLYMSLYKIDFGNDLKPFDLIIDANNISQEEVANLIIENINKHKDKKKRK
jgi:cytidylate kinase